MIRLLILFFFILFLLAGVKSTALALQPTPVCNGWPTAGQACGPDNQGIYCCPDPSASLVCVHTGISPDHGYICATCTQGDGGNCDAKSTSTDTCCAPGYACVSGKCQTNSSPIDQPTVSIQNPCPNNVCQTAIGNITTDSVNFIQFIFKVILSLSGGVAILMTIYGGYQLTVSQGNPEKVQHARETITSAIIGLLFVIFSVAILQIIGVDVLGLASFGK